MSAEILQVIILFCGHFADPGVCVGKVTECYRHKPGAGYAAAACIKEYN